MLSDDFYTSRGEVKGIWAQNIPLNQWTMLYKIRVNLAQLSLTTNSFRMWRAIQDQKDALDNLFQPVSGKIPKNFNQLSGDEMPIDGLFYAASIHSITRIVKQFELPSELKYPVSTEIPLYPDDCRKLFPNSTNLKPAFWIDELTNATNY